MNEPTASHIEPADHEEFLVLAEQAHRGEATAKERARLAEHLAVCLPCRDYVADLQQEQDIMEAVIDKVQSNCDFERIERAIANRRLLERFQDRCSLAFIIGFGLLALVSWWFDAPPGAVFAFAIMSACSALYRMHLGRQMAKWRDLADRSRSGDPGAYGTFRRSAQSQLAVEQAAYLLCFLAFAGMTVERMIEGRWVAATAMGLFALMFAFMTWENIVSRRGRERERAYISGEIDSDEYWMGDDSLRRGIRIARFLRLLRVNRYLRRFRRGGGSGDVGK